MRFTIDGINFRMYPRDLLEWDAAELLSLCLPFLLIAAVLLLFRRKR